MSNAPCASLCGEAFFLERGFLCVGFFLSCEGGDPWCGRLFASSVLRIGIGERRERRPKTDGDSASEEGGETTDPGGSFRERPVDVVVSLSLEEKHSPNPTQHHLK